MLPMTFSCCIVKSQTISPCILYVDSSLNVPSMCSYWKLGGVHTVRKVYSSVNLLNSNCSIRYDKAVKWRVPGFEVVIYQLWKLANMYFCNTRFPMYNVLIKMSLFLSTNIWPRNATKIHRNARPHNVCEMSSKMAITYWLTRCYYWETRYSSFLVTIFSLFKSERFLVYR